MSNKKKVLHQGNEGPNSVEQQEKVLHQGNEGPNSVEQQEKGPSSRR
ncbi:hypothetical protein [Neobacillus sp. PS3-40]|nr:hypothetical protein [Neobacillus sp. PS3-40]WML46124.1 hypothetical protein RCG20_09640 [Neobacillus sp. PS3-40]